MPKLPARSKHGEKGTPYPPKMYLTPHPPPPPKKKKKKKSSNTHTLSGQRYSGIGHSRDTPGGTPEFFRDTLRLGTPGSTPGRLQGMSEEKSSKQGDELSVRRGVEFKI